jgi:predicted membrane protein
VQNAWEVHFAPGLPLSIIVNIAAGELTLDVGGLAVQSLVVDMGAGESVIDLRGMVPGASHVQINTGLGGVRVYVPADFGVRAEVNTALGDAQAQGLRFLDEDGVYVNDAYRRGAPAIDMEIDTAVGAVEIFAGEGEWSDVDEPAPDEE